MRDERDVWNKTFYHRLIQEKLGKALSAGYDLSLPLPDRLSILLGQLDDATSAPLISADEPSTASDHEPGASPRVGLVF
jgi:hypothetical protein